MTDADETSARQRLQASQYVFPYHWIANDDAGYWSTCRAVPGGFAYLALLEEVRREVLAGQPASVLDFGCGDGRLAHLLARDGIRQVTGMDLSEDAIGFADAFPAPPGLRFECIAVEESPARRYETVVAMEVLEHIPDVDLPRVVGALHQRTAPDGRLVVSVPTTNVPTSPKHERHYTVEVLDEHVGPWFARQSARYVNRISALATGIDRVAANRLFALRHGGALRLATKAYRTRAVHASRDDGANLLATYLPAT